MIAIKKKLNTGSSLIISGAKQLRHNYEINSKRLQAAYKDWYSLKKEKYHLL